MKLKVEFSGGMELIFGGQREIEIDVPFQDPKANAQLIFLVTWIRTHALRILTPQATVAELLTWMRDNLVRERPELFMKGDSV